MQVRDARGSRQRLARLIITSCGLSGFAINHANGSLDPPLKVLNSIAIYGEQHQINIIDEYC